MYDTVSLVIRIDLDGRRPLDDQLAAALRLALARGEVGPGEDLPSARQLAADLGIHWNTVARTYRRLADEGILTVRHGRKAVVARRAATPAATVRASLRDRLIEAVSAAHVSGLSQRELKDAFKEALHAIQEKPSS